MQLIQISGEVCQTLNFIHVKAGSGNETKWIRAFSSLIIRLYLIQYKTCIAEECDYYHNSIPRKLPIGNSTGYFTRYIEIVREICNSMARVK